MQVKYINCDPMRVRNLQMKQFRPDALSFQKYVIALHGFAGSIIQQIFQPEMHIYTGIAYNNSLIPSLRHSLRPR